MDPKNVRNFSIIAHIDHGKSTLADRMLEVTNTVEKRKMKNQVLDSMELERERGITIKMAPVTMTFDLGNDTYKLNMIDTPGHIDFSYEVSRALKAVEGSILLVDSTQGIQAQTMTTLSLAKENNLTIIPVLTKIDSPLSRVDEVKKEISNLLDVSEEEIMETSGKTGEGVESLLKVVIEKIPPPKTATDDQFRSLVFGFEYSDHRGVIVYIRAFGGAVKKTDNLEFKIADRKFNALEVGVFAPEEEPVDCLKSGDIGYIVTGIKEPGIASVGDTVSSFKSAVEAMPGYELPKPLVWASIFPESQDDFDNLRQSLEKLRLSDSSFSFEEESSGALGRGFRCGFLGVLHLEILVERLKREFRLKLIVTTPSITYKIKYKDGKEQKIYSPIKFPEDHLIDKVLEPWVRVSIIVPNDYIGGLMTCIFDHEGQVGESVNFGDNRTNLSIEMPLRELMRNFFDEVKSLSSGFASIAYEEIDFREANVTRLDILIADERVDAFSKVISKNRTEKEAESTVDKLHKVLPRQLFVMKIQGKALGRIISSRTVKALKKDVTGHLYGGDISRKKKLWEKQKKGKKKMKERGKVDIPEEVFLKVMKDSK